MSARNEFEKLLKTSDHFADVINTHRTATAEIIAAVFALLKKKNLVAPEEIVSILRDLESSGGGVSANESRRHLVSIIRETIKRLN